ncbi:hypothetical protein H4Q26_007024 [Puccinia striiformis f. sp. tritici PST-130]|nr:hypothetical protein H4Q26_007024 [Puccinia striiformis f. sp. tritici PST-130]
MLARQLKIRLVAAESTDVPRNCANIVVSIHAIGHKTEYQISSLATELPLVVASVGQLPSLIESVAHNQYYESSVELSTEFTCIDSSVEGPTDFSSAGPQPSLNWLSKPSGFEPPILARMQIASVGGAFGGLLAYGIEMMEGLSGQKVARLKFVPKLNQKTLPLEVEEAQADSLTSTQGADVDADAGATAEDKTAPTPRDLTRFETEKPLPLLNPDVKVGHETDGSSPVEKFEKYEIIRAFKEPQVWFTGIGYMSLCVGNVLVQSFPVTDQAPHYRKGHSIALAFTCLAWVMLGTNALYCAWENKARAAGRRDSNITKYVTLVQNGKTSAPIGDRAPDFKLTL